MKTSNLTSTISIFLLLLLNMAILSAQNVGIGTNTPDASAKLQVASTNSGMLIPGVALSAVTNSTSPIANPATSLLVYNTNASVTGGDGVGFYYWNGSLWTKIGSQANTDEQDLRLGVGNNTSSILDMENGADVTIQAGAGIQLSENGSTLTIANSGDPSTTNELQTLAVTSPATSTNVTYSLTPSGNSTVANDGDWQINGTGLQGAIGGNTASGSNSFAVGQNNVASAAFSSAIGANNTANAGSAVAVGNTNAANSSYAVTIGYLNTLSSQASFGVAIGTSNEGFASHTRIIGNASKAYGRGGTTLGTRLRSYSREEVVVGRDNTDYTSADGGTGTFTNSAGDRMFVVGNGQAPTLRDGLVMQKNGNLYLGSDWSSATGSTGTRFTSGSRVLFLNSGTAPGSLTGSSKTAIWNQSGEIRVKDQSNNITTISPHNFSLIPQGPSEDLAWAYYSERGDKQINVDMAKLARLVEQLTGENLVYVKDTNTGAVDTTFPESKEVQLNTLLERLERQEKLIEQQRLELEAFKELVRSKLD